MIETEVRNLILEGSEVALKSLMDESILKQIPVVGWAVKICSITSSIRDELYKRKLSRFLHCLNQVPEEYRTTLKEKLNSNSEEINNVSKKILMILEVQTDIEKSDIIACLFVAYIDGRMTLRDFRRAIDVTCTAFLDDLLGFVGERASSGFHSSTFAHLQGMEISNLIGTPLIEMDQTTDEFRAKVGAKFTVGKTLYKMSSFGHLYYRCYQKGNQILGG